MRLENSSKATFAGQPPEPGAPARQCTARTKHGVRCRRSAIVGGFVCMTHGGATPQVRRKANMRLAALVEPAIATLAKEMVQAEKSADRQRAANSILDRAGFGRTSTIKADDAREILIQRLLEIRSGKKADGSELTEVRLAEQVQSKPVEGKQEVKTVEGTVVPEVSEVESE